MLGAGAANLTDIAQDELFDAEALNRHDRLLDTIDAVREKAGKGKLVWGSTLKHPHPEE